MHANLHYIALSHNNYIFNTNPQSLTPQNMADNFERHRSTRWVKADVPSYGDQWGDDYDNYDVYDQEVAEEPPLRMTSERRASGPSNLVLSIDNRNFDDDEDSERAFSQPPLAISQGGSFSQDLKDERKDERVEDNSSDEEVSYVPESPDREPQDQQQAPSRVVAQQAVHPAPARDEFIPPTPTFSQSNFSHHTPETPLSEHSYLSDADSIQREPETLNVASRHEDSLKEIEEDPNLEGTEAQKQEVSPALVLSVDNMNLNNDDSSDDSDSLHFGELARETSSTLQVDNQQEDDEKPHSPLHVNPSAELPTGRKHIKTDALDSLINDLLQMERLNTYATSTSSLQRDRVEKEVPPLPSTENDGEDEEREANLPSLTSIRDMSLPNFEDQSFSASAPDTSNMLAEVSPEKQEEVQKAHELYVSQLQGHTRSVKKAPPHSPNIIVQSDKSEAADENPVDTPSTPKQTSRTLYDPNNPLQIGVAPVLSPESISTKHLSTDFSHLQMQPPQLPKIPGGDVLRRDSTMTTSTFNMGNWKPNTSMYRDQFVNDNDNESQMNVSVYNGKENYERFVGARSSLGYAESFTNSSTLSVPETVALPSIHEDTSDAEVMRDEDETSDDRSMHSLEHTKSEGDISLPSVMKDRSSNGSVFKEEKLTLPGSVEQFPEDSTNKEKYKSLGSLESKSESELSQGPERAKSKRMASSSSFGVSKPANQKYPVFKWKDLTSPSQPIDRIEAFKRAKQLEFEYDTGLRYWLLETLQKAEVSSNIHIGKLAEEAYQNATHTDIRRHTSMALSTTRIRDKVSMVKDKMDSTAGFGRRFLNKGKKLMKS